MNSRNGTKAVLEQAAASSAAQFMRADILEYFKSLVGQIEIALPNRSCRVLLLSSSVPGEGTTEVTVGLGLALAAAMGRRTLLVDCNFRHPELHTRFGTPGWGLGEYMGREISLEKALATTVVPNLQVMAGGRSGGSLLATGKEDLERLLDDLRSRFDYVLIDAGPVSTDPEGGVLCSRVDSVILVVRHGSTKREVVKVAADMIARAGGRVLGVVFNRRRFPIPEFLYKRL